MCETCPLCGFPISAPESLPELKLTKSEQKIYDLVRSSGTTGIKIEKLTRELWGHKADGGPINPNVSINQFLVRINHKIKSQGLVIVNGSNQRTKFPRGYSLVKL